MLKTLKNFNANEEMLRQGYAYAIAKIFSPREFYERSLVFTSQYRSPLETAQQLTCLHISTLLFCIWKLGVLGQDKRYFWKLLLASIFRNRRNLSLSITLMIYGLHFHRFIKPA